MVESLEFDVCNKKHDGRWKKVFEAGSRSGRIPLASWNAIAGVRLQTI